MTLFDRAFVRLAEGVVHYRHVGGGDGDTGERPLPLYMAHSGPGSSRAK